MRCPCNVPSVLKFLRFRVTTALQRLGLSWGQARSLGLGCALAGGFSPRGLRGHGGNYGGKDGECQILAIWNLWLFGIGLVFATRTC